MKCFAVSAVVVLVLLATVVSGCGGSGSSSGKEPGASLPRTNVTTPGDSQVDTAPQPKDTTPAEKDDGEPQEKTATEEEAIIQAALAGARANNPQLGELKVLGYKVIGDWARVEVVPVDGSTDAASAILKKSGDTWKVIDFGTGITPQQHPEAPAELFR